MAMKKMTLLLLYVCVFASAEAQNLIRIPQDAATLSAAVQLAQSGDTILLSAGVYTDSVHIDAKTLIIMGDPNGGSILSPGINEKSFVLTDADIEFIGLEFDDFQQNSPPPNFAISATDSDVKIDHCSFNNFFSPLSVYWGHLELSHSVFSGTRGNSGIQHNGGTFLVYNNLIYDLANTSYSINRANGQFFNNTIVGSTPSQYRGLLINSDTISHIYNNIIEGFGIGIQVTASDSAELNALRIYNNNIYNIAAPYWYEYNTSLSLPIFSGALTPDPGTGEISLASDFVDAANGNFRLQPSSNCINAGINAYPFPVGSDLGGQSRIIGSNPDMGAYEYSELLGIETQDMSNQLINIYPQPAHQNIWIEFKEDYYGTIEVLDITGAILKQITVNGTSKIELDLTELSGILLLRMINDQQTSVRPILKVD